MVSELFADFHSKADLFLYNLRYATIVECRQTTKIAEILRVVKLTGIDRKQFSRHYNGTSAAMELQKDFSTVRALSVNSLPSYLLEYKGREILIRSLIGYEDFVGAIHQLTKGEIIPSKVIANTEALEKFLTKHPLISPIEIREAFDLPNEETVQELIQPLVEDAKIEIQEVYHGWFIRRKGYYEDNI